MGLLVLEVVVFLEVYGFLEGFNCDFVMFWRCLVVWVWRLWVGWMFFLRGLEDCAVFCRVFGVVYVSFCCLIVALVLFGLVCR